MADRPFTHNGQCVRCGWWNSLTRLSCVWCGLKAALTNDYRAGDDDGR